MLNKREQNLYQELLAKNIALPEINDAFLKLGNSVIKRDYSNRKYIFYQTQRIKNYCIDVMTKGTPGYEECFQLYWKILLFEAQNKQLDSYLLYLERYRQPKDRFYLPRRDCFIKHGLIDAMQGLIDDKYDILCISLPPGTGKTTLEEFFASGVMGWFHKDYSLFYSHSADITRMFYDSVLNILTDEQEYTWHEIFPYLNVTRTNAKTEQINVGKFKPFPTLQTTSIGASNAGKVRASKFLYCDDLIAKLEDALNKNTLDKIWGAYTVDARQRKVEDSDGKPCKEIHLATRWSVNDQIGRLQRIYEGNPRVKFIAVPDIDPKTGESNFDYAVGGFTKEFFADQALLMDDISYKCLYKQQPIEREGLLYHEDELRRYTTLPEKEPDAIFGVCDVKNKGTDFMSLPIVKQYGSDYYLCDVVFDDNTDFGTQRKKCGDILLENNVQKCQFESNAGGDRFAEDVTKYVEAYNGRCNITTKPTETNKETKIIVNADWVKKHVLFKAKEAYTKKSDYGRFMDNLLSYSITGKTEHDDAPDSMAMLALFATKDVFRRQTVIIQNPFM